MAEERQPLPVAVLPQVPTQPPGALVPQPGLAEAAPAIPVLKDPNCGCCDAWVRILQAEGFEAISEASFGTLLIRHKRDNGIPQQMIFCHTAETDGYFFEGPLFSDNHPDRHRQASWPAASGGGRAQPDWRPTPPARPFFGGVAGCRSLRTRCGRDLRLQTEVPPCRADPSPTSE